MNTLVLTYDMVALRDTHDSFSIDYNKGGQVKITPRANIDDDYKAATFVLHHLEDTSPVAASDPPDVSGSSPCPTYSLPDNIHVFKYQPCCRCTGDVFECDCIVGRQLTALAYANSKHWVVPEPDNKLIELKNKYFLGIIQSFTVEPAWPYTKCHFVVALHGKCWYRFSPIAYFDKTTRKCNGYSVTLKALESSLEHEKCEHCGNGSCQRFPLQRFLVQPPVRT